MDTTSTVRKGTDKGIFGVIREEVLMNITNNLSEATGIPFFVIDFKGECVTGTDNYSCFEKKEDYNSIEKIRIMYALAAAKSAIRNGPYIFQTPKKYLNMVIPIIIHEQYTGAMVGGPVSCTDSKGMASIEDLTQTNEGVRIRNGAQISEMTVEQFQKVAELAFFMVDVLSENARSSVLADQYDRDQQEIITLRERNEELVQKIRDLEYGMIMEAMPYKLITNLLTIASSFSILENAKKTESILFRITSFMRHYLSDADHMALVKDELKCISDLFQVIAEQYDRKLECRIHCEKELETVRIPVFSILSFVLLMTSLIVDRGNEDGIVYIDVESKDEMCRITMQLEAENNQKVDLLTEGKTGIELQEKILNVQKRFEHDYEDSVDIMVNGNMVDIEFPRFL